MFERERTSGVSQAMHIGVTNPGIVPTVLAIPFKPEMKVKYA